MEKKFGKVSVGDIILLAISVIYLIGILTFFGPCGPKDDGSWMTCHWAGQAVTGLAAVLTIIAVIHILVPNAKIKTGLDIAVIPVALLAAIIPGNLINLCMMDTMRCHSIMRPAVIVMSILVIAAAVFNVITQRNKG